MVFILSCVQFNFSAGMMHLINQMLEVGQIMTSSCLQVNHSEIIISLEVQYIQCRRSQHNLIKEWPNI